ncbi:unnamed protein product [Ostreobium quekettii]|uniref:Uncharacterized protein n=1 Tax=Ostreobium quekettii TaxID=121088 RepID=A0A8S1J4T3_9CHLO|nr:unnamed protein product [Ostreobium quekettii]|eukprot:evm.model.scf_870.3 EVM.evm.TU.scf_870.3   scf_870:17727-32026(+)
MSRDGDYIPDEDFEEVNRTGSLEETEATPVEEEYESADAESQDGELDEDEEVVSPSKREIARQERERLRLHERQKREALEALRREQNEDVVEGESARSSRRLNYLLKQAEIFQHFAPQAVGRRTGARGQGRLQSRCTEELEDKELLQDEEDGGEAAGHRLLAQPASIKGGKMRDYQLQGLNWLIHLYQNGINGILADEMGLGKTLQTISLLGYLNEFRGITGPHLVIVPKSTLHNWINEFKRWCPMINAVKFHGNQDQRAEQRRELLQPGRFDVCVTSYEMVIKEKGHLRRFHWRYIIIDEAHRIKNENSLLSKVVRLLRTNYRLLITGTPLQNNLHELWALLNFLLPEVFASAERFEEWFNLEEGGKEKEAEVVQQLHKVLRPFLLRRVKSDVERGLPPKKEAILKIGMSAMQRKWYAAILQKDIGAINGGADRSRLLNIVMQLRKCCNHPYLFQGAEPGPPFTTDEHLIETSGKMVLLDKLLVKLKARNSRVLIFSQMTRALDILEDYCLFRGHAYCRIDGSTSGDEREAAIDDFNREGSEKFVFLLSTRAGGLGINLATADVVILYDSDWNPQMDLQAMDRAHRIGQKKEVQVLRFCIENSIEEKVIEKAYKKLRLDALVIQQGRLTETNKNKVSKEDLLSMVRYGAELVFKSDAAAITEADIDAIIAKGEKDTKELNEKMSEFTENAMKFTLDGGLSVYDYKTQEEAEKASGDIDLKHLIGENWIDPPKRDRKRVLNYSENNQGRSRADRPTGPRLPKMPNLQDFQFFDVPRLTELLEKENSYELFKYRQRQKEEHAAGQGASEGTLQSLLAPGPDDPQPLSPEEVAEKERLLQEGFTNWNRRDFNAFVRACEKYGRRDVASVAQEIEGKTPEEVKEYAKVFWKRVEELNDWERIVKNVERGEYKIKRQRNIMKALVAKLDRYKNPWLELKIPYGGGKGKVFTEEEDRFLVCMVNKCGYGAWDALKAELRKCWRFRFDWFFKSRTPQELARRVDTLIRMIEKENEEIEAEEREERKKVGGKRAGGSSSKVHDSAASSKKRRAPSSRGGISAKKQK